MKTSVRLRTQLILLMALLVFLQSLSLVVALMLSRVFFLLDAEAFRLLGSTTQTRMQDINKEAGQLIAGMSEATDTLNERLLSLAAAAQAAPETAFAQDDLYREFALKGTQTLVQLLQNNSITGAFFMLQGSNANKTDALAHSAVYLRNSAPGSPSSGTDTFLLEIGPIHVSQQYQIATSIRWDLDVRFDAGEAGRYAFYEKPVWAAQAFPGAEIER